MLKMSTKMENIVNAYKTLAKIPSIVSGRINRATNKVTVQWSVRNLDRGKSSKFVCDYVLDDKLGVVSVSDFGIDVTTELISKVSPKETYKALIREEKDAKDVKKQYLEVWSGNQIAHSIDLTALELHGDVYTDSEFGCLDWSPDESSLVYIAEKKLPKSEPYVKRKPASDETKIDQGTGDKPIVRGEEYIYKQDWGEQLVGKHLSVIVVFRLRTESFSILEGLPETWCPGQVSFSADGDSVVGVAWETEPRRLGLIFCTNRPSTLFKLTLGGHFTNLSAAGMSVRSPRVRSGVTAYLQRKSGGPHHAAHDLVLINEKSEQKVLIPSSAISTTTDQRVFYGIYCLGLPSRCWSHDGSRVLFSTPQKNDIRSYVVNIVTGAITDITNCTLPGSTSILDVTRDCVLAVCSSSTRAHELYIAWLPPVGKEDTIRWIRISDPIALPDTITNAQLHYMDLAHKDCDDSVTTFSALYTAPSSGGKLPLIVSPHGGPHSSFVDAYSLETAFFTMLGFAFLRINYRGSTGQGQASVDFLPGKAGVADVRDCLLATDHAVKLYPIDQSQVFLFGGSHGGFLVTHLIGQVDYYRACVARNPVVDIASMFGSTDIADWCAVEAGFDFTEHGPLSEEELLAMRRASPIANVHRVQTPTALMLGSGDKRVPHFQGLEYYRRLKANGVKTRLYMYDDNHSLSSQSAEMDNLINSVAWFFGNIV